MSIFRTTTAIFARLLIQRERLSKYQIATYRPFNFLYQGYIEAFNFLAVEQYRSYGARRIL
jgi:hypothetical protein